MYIIVIAWIYVVFMMSITETSAVAGVMTFLLYGVLPVSIIFYIGTTGKRKELRKRRAAEEERRKEIDKPVEEKQDA